MSDASVAASAATAARTEIAVELANVTFGYDERPVLTGISMTIPLGKVVAIMGGSGCGKTTILRLIGGQLKPQSGRVLVAGQSVPDLDRDALYEMRRRFGMLFQFGALFTDMSVYENVAFALREHTSWPEERIAERVTEVLGFVNLGRDVERLLPSSLSGGMKKRVSLARTIALKPEVLLYDEPTTGFDPVTSMTINRLIKDLNTRLGTTSVVVTHDIVSALFVADRITFLKNGRFVFSGTPEEARASDVPELKEFLSAGESLA